jgi:hypothetical protein
MQALLIIALAVHVLAAVFWAGATFTLARTGGLGAERLFAPQIGAAVFAVLSGGYLWGALHRGRFEPPEQVLAAGIFAALLALVLQVGLGGRTMLALRRGTIDADGVPQRIARAQRVTAGLLAITVICMATARYA